MKGNNFKKPRSSTETKKSRGARRAREARRREEVNQQRIEYEDECDQKSKIGLGYGL